MTDPTFAASDRVYHRGLKRYGTFIEHSWTSGESVVEVDDPAYPDDEDCLRITTAQLVPANQTEEQVR